VTIHVTIWDRPAGAGSASVLVHGTLSWGTHCYAEQRPLARRFRLLIPDRRGFGASPDLDDPSWTSDYAVDAEDVIGLLGGGAGVGAHLVGHSYGAVVAMLAAATRPDLIRSLTLIEPSAHMAAIDAPPVAAAVERSQAFMARARQATPADYLRAAFDDAGLTRPEPADLLARAARTALGERPCWLADIPIAPLTKATFPKLVITGAWDVEAPGYPPGTGEVLQLVATTVANKIKANLVRIPGTAHEPHRDRPKTVNALLTDLWTGRA
jgi:pimeloyl-ACP methyl ester carboxylesterase